MSDDNEVNEWAFSDSQQWAGDLVEYAAEIRLFVICKSRIFRLVNLLKNSYMVAKPQRNTDAFEK